MESRDLLNNDHHFLSESERQDGGVRDLRMGKSEILAMQKEKEISK